MQIPTSPNDIQTPTVIALGNFDGVHRGHREVIEPILRLSPGADARLSGCCPTVVTFSPHPQEFFSGQRRALLTPLPEKARVLQAMGVEQLVVLPFDAGLASLSPQQFVENILVERLQARVVSVGQDFRFGHRRAGTTEDLRAIAAPYQIIVHIVPLHIENESRISSSAIRQALQDGKLSLGNHLLGRSYELVGQVVAGQQLGRQLGFPTANLQLPVEKFLPCRGVYAVWVNWDEEDSLAGTRSLLRRQPGVMNLGVRPTLNGVQQTVEVHLLDWSGDLYGKTLTVSLETLIRPEQKFDSLSALKEQIQKDCAVARSLLTQNPLPVS